MRMPVYVELFAFPFSFPFGTRAEWGPAWDALEEGREGGDLPAHGLGEPDVIAAWLERFFLEPTGFGIRRFWLDDVTPRS